MGMFDQWYTLTMFDAQAYFIRDCIRGRINLPSSEKMLADIKSDQAKEDSLCASDTEGIIRHQTAHFKSWVEQTDYQKLLKKYSLFLYF